MLWFLETPWPPIFACAALAMILIAGLYLNKRGVYLIGVIALAVIGLGIYVVERMIVTERERVEAALYEMVADFQDLKLRETLEHFSERNTEDRRTVMWAMKLFASIENLRITDLSIEMRAQDSRAVSHFRANADVVTVLNGDLGRQNSRWEMTWQKEGGEWRVVKTVRLHPYQAERIPIRAIL